MQKILETRGRPAQHHMCFLLFMILSLMALWPLLSALVTLSLHDDSYSHILAIPIISLSLLFLDRKSIFTGLGYSPAGSAVLFLLGIISYWAAKNTSSSEDANYRLSLEVCAMISMWMAGFVLCYGTRCVRAALFPLLFLLLMVPVPQVILDKIVFMLQKGSVAVAYVLFRLLSVPVFRHGFTFALPGVEIEVAKECSGIRSSIALLITGLLACHVFLRSNWRRILLCALTVPIAMFKNAVRIVTISWLGIYVDPSFLYGNLHHYGGVPFSLIALAIWVPTLAMLQKTEAASEKVSGRKSSYRTSLEGQLQPSETT
jgi:exosortase